MDKPNKEILERLYIKEKKPMHILKKGVMTYQ